MRVKGSPRCGVALLKVTVAVAALIAGSGVANAQDADSAETESAGETAADRSVDAIIVTARRVGEDVQDIPISVGTMNAEALQANAITGFQDLKANIAGLTTQKTGTAGGGFTTIRGLTPVASPQPASDQGVGFFIDGVYVARSQGSGVPLVDVSRVEVLRGPQGTLFGRNSSIGTINFITNTPVDRYEASLRMTGGNYNAFEAEAMINAPVTQDLIVRLAYLHKEMAGDVKNTTTAPGFIYGNGYGDVTPAKTFDASNSESYVAKLRYDRIEDVTVDYKYDREEQTGSANANQLIGFAPTSALLGLISAIYPFQPQGAVQQSFSRLGSLSEDHTGGYDITNQGHLLNIEAYLGNDMTAKSITAYRSTKSANSTDLDGGSWIFPQGFIPGFGGPLCVSCSTNEMDQHAWSQELQLMGKAGDLAYTLGAFYFDEHATFENTYSVMAVMPYAPEVYMPTIDQTVVPPLGTPGDRVLGNDGIYDNRSIAAYAHVDYRFSDFFDVSAGARYTWDNRKTNDLRSFGSGLSTYKDSRFTYDVAANFHIDYDRMIYLKYGSGYTSGGVDSNITFKPEINDQVEAGFKGEFLNRKLRFNAAAYYSWVKNRQTTVPNTSSANCSPVLIAAGFTPGECPVGLFVFNLPGTSKVGGFEIETELRPVYGLTLTANYAYNDPKFSTGEFNRAPKTNISLASVYDFPSFDSGAYVTVRLDGNYRSKYYGTGGNVDGAFVGTVPEVLRAGLSNEEYLAGLRDATISGGYWLVNARAAITEIPLGNGRSTIEFATYVRNLTNTKDPYYTVNYGASFHASFERPRTYGASVSIDF